MQRSRAAILQAVNVLL